ncbi:MAG: hypothetical protein M3409_12350, partial [Gemmatimonadota bacterium]|nr:hypothetical protein [Gemmatimonadota bacterium]
MSFLLFPDAPPTPRTPTSVWERWSEYLRRPPEMVLEWSDAPTGARGWMVINSLRGGAAGGGTRMRAGLGREEVVYLAKAMELKFVFSGPPIGGAKSGICFDPTDSRREEVLERWFRAAAPQLRSCIGTGGDLHVDQVRDVIPACERLGLRHPQEGMLRAHLGLDDARLPGVLAALEHGVTAPLDGALGVEGLPLSVADMVTGFGVARAVLRWFEVQGRPPEGARVLVEGWGAVGAPCALYLARAGMRVVGIADREKALVDPEGIAAAGVEALLRARGPEKLLPADDPRVVRGVERVSFWNTPAEVFVCAACSNTVDEATLDQLARTGVETIACGANQPFHERSLGDTAVQRLADERFTVLPDVVANCGMARAFSYLAERGAVAEPEAIFAAVDRTIADVLAAVHRRNAERPVGLLAATLDLALD